VILPGKVKSEAKDRPTYKLIDSIPFLREVRKKKSYVMLYNSQTRNATWVYEILNKSTLAGTQSRKRDLKFKDELFEPLYEAANIEECDESEYEQGHLASAANHKWCQEAYEDTFILSNIAPQVPYLNQNLWKELENHCQAKINNSSDIRNVHVYSGPIYPQCDKRKKAERVKSWRKKIVPTHFFKVIIIEHENGTVELECYKMPNEEPKNKNKKEKDKNKQEQDKNKQSKDKNKQEKDKNKQSKDKNRHSKDKNKQEKDKNKIVLKDYIVPIKEIEAESGLTFTESSCTEGEVDITRKVKLVGGNGNEGSCSAEIKVTICTPLTNHNDFVYM
ncbi:endonuclease G, mitochondrial-like, partial [Carassius auratus]|uniref:Endonuclease G, mitochondrial-like n=1 Tax=Carassius auratus TaxID=7957 RepID=A0A6P6L2K6_CARAU